MFSIGPIVRMPHRSEANNSNPLINKYTAPFGLVEAVGGGV